MYNYPSQLKIESYSDPRELDKAVAIELIAEFKQPGLILLPAGRTFEEIIYKHVDEYFKNSPQELNTELRLSQLDELIIPAKSFIELETNLSAEDPRFSVSIRRSLSAITERIGFFAIDTDDLRSYQAEIYRDGGPRRIYMGLGADPNIAHIAFIAEGGYLNSEIAKVPLQGFDVRSSYRYQGKTIREAVTIGTDLFRDTNAELIVVAKGAAKQASLRRACEDPDTGLGYLIANHSDRLRIIADAAAI